MKRSLLTGSLFVMTLVQGLAHAQIVDLPDPGSDTATPTQVTNSTPATPQTQTQFAGILRVGPISRKTGGTVYKIDFAKASRLQRLDVRVSSNRVKIYSTELVTASGNKISVRQLSTAAVLETNAVVNSENITLNENVTSVEILMEAYGGEADIILTAVASFDVPKMTLRPEVKVQPQPPVVVNPTIDDSANNSGTGYDPYNPGSSYPDDSTVSDSYDPGSGSITYYGDAKFRAGMTVLLACDRDCANPNLWLATVEQNFGRGDISVLQRGERLYVRSSDLSASTNCYGSFCVNDRVYHGRGNGFIAKLFEDGTAAVQAQGAYFLTNVRNLNKAPAYVPAPAPAVKFQQCTRNNEFCTGDTIRYRGTTAKIIEIFGNGQARIRNPNNGYTALVFIRELIFVR